jgi:hypothetical protein
MKKLFDIGVYEYDSLDEAKQDAHAAADDIHKAANRHRQIMHVLHSHGTYIAPVNDVNVEWNTAL